MSVFGRRRNFGGRVQQKWTRNISQVIVANPLPAVHGPGIDPLNPNPKIPLNPDPEDPYDPYNPYTPDPDIPLNPDPNVPLNPYTPNPYTPYF